MVYIVYELLNAGLHGYEKSKSLSYLIESRWMEFGKSALSLKPPSTRACTYKASTDHQCFVSACLARLKMRTQMEALR